MEITVGQILYYWKRGEIQETKVAKIARKYIYLEGNLDRYPIEKQTLKYIDKVYTQHNFQLYLTKKEILDGFEYDKLCRLIHVEFDRVHNYDKTKRHSLETLRKIAELLNLKIE